MPSWPMTPPWGMGASDGLMMYDHQGQEGTLEALFQFLGPEGIAVAASHAASMQPLPGTPQAALGECFLQGSAGGAPAVLLPHDGDTGGTCSSSPEQGQGISSANI